MGFHPVLSLPSCEQKLYLYMWEKVEKVERRWVSQLKQRDGETVLLLLALLRLLWLGQCRPHW